MLAEKNHAQHTKTAKTHKPALIPAMSLNVEQQKLTI
jgi:hypothetical protein